MSSRVQNAHVLQRERTKPVREQNEDERRADQRDEPSRATAACSFRDLKPAFDE
jgi:hypothetical protein